MWLKSMALKLYLTASTAVEPGEVVTILGPSGSGKSTLIRLINQLESLSDGEIFIDGKPISQLRGAALRQLRSRIGFVFQQFNLYSHLTALQNIALALEYVHGWNKTEADRRALELLEKVGLAEKPMPMPHSCPVDSSSAWPSPARWLHHRKLFCLMNPPPRWILK